MRVRNEARIVNVEKDMMNLFHKGMILEPKILSAAASHIIST